MHELPPSLSTYFGQLDEFGLFESIEDQIATDYTIIYEIARVFEDKEHELSERLAPVMFTSTPPHEEEQDEPPIPILPWSEEYEATLITSPRDVVNIYPHQFLYPDEVFDRKLAERTLLMPVPRQPNNRTFDTESDDYQPDSRKQKVYVLLDTSSSMMSNYRIHLAKAIVYSFLKQNMKELGTIWLRTFDVSIGEKHHAYDQASFLSLIRYLMHIDSLGNGTAMEKAIQVAIDDIKENDDMADAHILMITDGAVHLNEGKVREWLGNNITLHTVKIGNAVIRPNPAYVRDQILVGNSDQSKLLRKIEEREREVMKHLREASSGARKHQYEAEIRGLRTQKRKAVDTFTKHIEETYGTEIEHLSDIFIEIDDIDPGSVFGLREQRIGELREATNDMLNSISDPIEADEVKEAAILFNHLEFLTDHNPDNEELKEMAEQLKAELEQFIDEDDPDRSRSKVRINMKDHRQIMKLLKPMLNKRGTSLMTIIKLFLIRLKRKFLLWRQQRKYKVQ